MVTDQGPMWPFFVFTPKQFLIHISKRCALVANFVLENEFVCIQSHYGVYQMSIGPVLLRVMYC